MANLYVKRLTQSNKCPRCKVGIQTLWHVFGECPTSIEISQILNFEWVITRHQSDYFEWLTWVFGKSTESQQRLVVVDLVRQK